MLLSPPAAHLLGLELRDEQLLADDAGGTSNKRWALPSVRLLVEGFAPEQIPVGVQEMIHDGVLGTSFLEQRVLTLDLARGLAWGARRLPGDPPSSPHRD